MFLHEHSSGCECSRFYLIQDDYRLSFRVKQQYPNKYLQWDPWPVRQHRVDCLLSHVQALVASRNAKSADHAVDAVDILRASPCNHGLQTSSMDRGLYSIRSPSMLPIRVHIWTIPGGKMLVRRGHKVQTLSSFLDDLGCFRWKDPATRLEFWKSLPTRDQFIAMANPPQNLRRKVALGWHEANPFRFLDLPAELREIVLCFALGLRSDATWQCRLPRTATTCYGTASDEPSDRLKVRYIPDLNANLLLANKQVNQEATAALSANLLVRFKDFRTLYHFMEQDLRIRPCSRTQLRYIQLDFRKRMDYLGAFGIPAYKNRKFEYFNNAGFKLLTFTDADRSALKGISIYFPRFNGSTHDSPGCQGHLTRCACQHALNEDLLIGARPLLRRVRLIEFTGHINSVQKERWLQMIAEDRRATGIGPEELSSWQQEAWQAKYGPFFNTEYRVSTAEDETAPKQSAPAAPNVSDNVKCGVSRVICRMAYADNKGKTAVT